MTSRRHTPAPGNSLEDRLKQKAASEQRRQALIAAMSRRTVKDTAPEAIEPRVHRDAAATLKGIDCLRLYNVGDTTAPKTLSASYRALLEAAVEVMNSGSRLVLLCWPPQPICLSGVVDLLALGDVASTPQKQVFPEPGRVDMIADPPLGLRAVLFPYARTTHTPAREIQVDRQGMATLHRCHALRSIYGKDAPALKDYHTVLSRVRAMSGKAKDGQTYTEFEHPILDEIVPHGSARDGCRENGSLLWRTKSKTDLGELSRSGAADRPETARFFLFDIHASDNIGRELKAIDPAPDLILLDFLKTGRGRLGRDWIASAQKAVDTILAAHPSAGILAITDDPWTYDAVRFEVLGTRATAPAKRRKPSPARAVYAPSGAILNDPDNTEAPQWTSGTHILVDGFTGQLDGPVSHMRTIAKKLRDRGNPDAADAARNIVAKLRRSVSLPGSLAELSEFLEREAGDAIAADNMAAYRVNSDLAILDDPRRGATQVGSDELSSARTEVNRLVAASEAATPMASLLEEALAPAMRASSRTAFVFRNEMIADFALDRLSQKFDKLESKLESGVIRFTSRQGFSDLAGLASSLRNQFKRAIIVAPTRQSALEILSQPWLPDEVTLLTDSDTLRFSARDAARLASQLDQPELEARLNRFAASANTRVREIGAHVVALDETIAPADDVEFPFGSIIDLSGSHRGDRNLLELEMNSGQRILARPRTGLVLRDGTRSVPRFIEVAATNVSVGDEICVISPGFVEKARTLLNITAAAAEEIRDYHDLVRKRFAAFLGATPGERLRALCAKMGEPAVHAGTARYWIDLDGEADKPLHEVVPHAPQDRETFMRFTQALGISPELATRFWAWAVIAQRSSRLRAGAAFHDAYKGILTDEHSALAANRGRAAEILALRAAADEYVSAVASIKKRGQA
jgi:hypothetical protein